MRCAPRTARTLVASALVPVSLLVAAPPAGAGPNTSIARVTAYAPTTQKAQLLDAINAARAAAGVPALRVDVGVSDSARQWAAHLARTGTLRHHPDLAASLQGQGVTGWTLAAENVGVGQHVSQIQGAFMQSPRHRANTLDARFSAVGVGVTRGADGRVWVAVHFVAY